MSRRLIAFGAGAVGGVVAAQLHEAGHDVAIVARGEHLAAIQRDGLILRTPEREHVARVPAASDPAQLEAGRPGDVVLLGVKSQDTPGALRALAAAGALDAPLVCLQNGVENERAALRVCPDVYGAVIQCPTAHLTAGVVEAYGTRSSGMIDLGRYPGGEDALTAELVDALDGAGFIATATPDISHGKYGKLLLNLGNSVRALFAASEARSELARRAKQEGRDALDAAGIAYADESTEELERRWERIGIADIHGNARAGSSTWQSLARGTRAIETDYLNGEIALVGRLHGVPTPVNAALCRIAADAARRGAGPEELDAGELLAVAR